MQTLPTHEWYLTNSRKIDYILVLVTCDKLGDRFLRGPWKLFIESLGKEQKIQLIHYTEEDMEDLPHEFVERWYVPQMNPYLAIFTKQSWDREEDYHGWVFHGAVDNHWTIDKVVTPDLEAHRRFDEQQILDWYQSIVYPNLDQAIQSTKEVQQIAVESTRATNHSYFKI